MIMARIFRNPYAVATLDVPAPTREPLEFHRRLPGYVPTPLIDAAELATTLQADRIWIKDESSRLGLPAFKMLGASWAVYRALVERIGGHFQPWNTLDELAEQLAPLRPLTLTAATDGNHGRAVARMAALLGFQSRIFVPAGTATARIEAIAGEGASVTIVDGSYDDAVDRAAAEASERCLVISDTSWPGYEEIPRWVIDGYSTIFWEVDDELMRRHEDGPDLVVVQVGVGALAAAVVQHYRRQEVAPRPNIVSVEPMSAACVLASMEAGRIVEAPGPHDSIMAGLNCGRPSLVAWPIVSSGVNLFIAIDDHYARQGMRDLAAAGMVVGETGAAGLGGLIALLTSTDADTLCSMLGVDRPKRVLLLATEGATDPTAYQQIVGHAAGSLYS
jgi:diaminopropionate ammonia-lyase